MVALVPMTAMSSLYRGPTTPISKTMGKMVDRAINASIVLAAGTFAITKLLTIDHDYLHVNLFFSFPFLQILDYTNGWMQLKNFQGWTLFEIVKYEPLHN